MAPATRAAWGRLGRPTAYVVAAAFATQTILYLLDRTGVLAPQVSYSAGSVGVQQALIEYYAAYHERMHDIWWNVAVRDVLGPVGYVALIVLVRALLPTAGTGTPREQIANVFVVLGACAAALSDVMYLSHIAWWRPGGFLATPDIIAYGRAFDIVDNVGTYIQWAGYLLLALGFVCLAPTLSAGLRRHRWLALLAYLEVGALLAFVASSAVGAPLANGAGAASGVILGPALAILVGHVCSARRG